MPAVVTSGSIGFTIVPAIAKAVEAAVMAWLAIVMRMRGETFEALAGVVASGWTAREMPAAACPDSFTAASSLSLRFGSL